MYDIMGSFDFVVVINFLSFFLEILVLWGDLIVCAPKLNK